MAAARSTEGAGAPAFFTRRRYNAGMSEERPPRDEPADALVLQVGNLSPIHLKAVTEFGEPVELQPADAREVAKALVELARQISPEEESLPEPLESALRVGRDSRSTDAGPKRQKFTLRDLMVFLVWFGLGLAPISAMLNGGGPVSFFAIFSPPCIGAAIGTLFQRTWTGFNYGLGVLLAISVIVPLLALIAEVILAFVRQFH